MRIFIKELTKVLEQKEKAVILYNKTGNALPLLSAVDQMEKYIGKIIFIRETDMYDNFNGYDDENSEGDEYDIYGEDDFDDDLYDAEDLNEDELDDDEEDDFYDDDIDDNFVDEDDDDDDDSEEDF